MTDTRSQSYSYELVPGPSAYVTSRVVSAIVGFFAIVAGCSLAYLRVSAPDDGHDALTAADWFLMLGPIVVAILAGAMGFTFLSRRSKVETAAGYTTLTSGHANLDQVNPRTGVVIRRAGSVVLTEPGRDGLVDDATGNPNELTFTGSSGSRNRFIYGGIAVAVAIGAATYGGLSGSDGDVGLTLIIVAGIVGLLAVVLAISFAGVAAYTRGLVRPAAKGRPDDVVFLSQKTPELTDAASVGVLTVPKARLIPVSVSADGLELWGKHGALDPASVIPWSSITRVQPGRLLVTNGNRTFTAATLHVFRMVDGVEQDFPLPIYGANGLGFAGAAYANTVLEAVARRARIA